jgi:hypothetical protein
MQYCPSAQKKQNKTKGEGDEIYLRVFLPETPEGGDWSGSGLCRLTSEK